MYKRLSLVTFYGYFLEIDRQLKSYIVNHIIQLILICILAESDDPRVTDGLLSNTNNLSKIDEFWEDTSSFVHICSVRNRCRSISDVAHPSRAGVCRLYSLFLRLQGPPRPRGPLESASTNSAVRVVVSKCIVALRLPHLGRLYRATCSSDRTRHLPAADADGRWSHLDAVAWPIGSLVSKEAAWATGIRLGGCVWPRQRFGGASKGNWIWAQRSRPPAPVLAYAHWGGRPIPVWNSSSIRLLSYYGRSHLFGITLRHLLPLSVGTTAKQPMDSTFGCARLLASLLFCQSCFKELP